ncbi:hypothetical protein JKF63_05403 [Porcisia hertigi]|uniref:Uncharacterized protein n=1 Tax=Porcisia hertigi TaxID=2761500 RepID=A0A836IEV7_9TRYP|nr:hypothetical protein JKF63_05403 [Porcisia hertigi]
MSGSTKSDANDSRRASSAMVGCGGGSNCDSDDGRGGADAQQRGALLHAVHRVANVSGPASSSHTLSQPREPTRTAARGVASPTVTSLERGGGGAAAASGVQSSRLTAARISSPESSHPLFCAESSTPVAAAPHDIRDTAEYRAAWDLELWKAVQADRFRKELEKRRGVAFADLNQLVKRREREARLTLQQRTTELARREEVLQAEETRLAEHERRVADMEKDLRRMRQQLLDAQHRVEDEVRAQVRLANDTIAHRARLLEERVKAAEAQARHADERQRQAQQEYLSLYEAFSRYRTQQLISPNSEGGGITAASGGAAASSLQMVQLRVQWEAEHQLQLDRQAQRHASDMAAVQQRCQELEEQNKRLTVALARRREQLRRRVEDALPLPLPTSVSQRQSPRGGRAGSEGVSSDRAAASPSSTPPSAVGPSSTPFLQPANGLAIIHDFVERTSHELHRLESERLSLVEGSSGALRETDTVIVRIDARIRELREQLSAVTSTT